MRRVPSRIVTGVAQLVLSAIVAAAGAQQTPEMMALSRSEAVSIALTRGPRTAAARADTAVAFARLLAARTLQNPTLSASYSKSTPNYHITAELPFDLPGVRGNRIRAAEADRLSAGYTYQFTRAAIALDADTTYTRALAAQAHSRLSRRGAADADSLLTMAIARRDAGDASELDVQLARLFAGQQRNRFAADSVTFVSTLLDLQAVIGLAYDRVAVVITDSLTKPPTEQLIAQAGTTLQVAAARAALTAAELRSRVQRRSRFGSPSLMGGFETGDPSGSEPGVLPTFGIGIPLPILDRNRGAIAEADAERERSRAELALATVESATRIAQATRERQTALQRMERDRQLVATAERIAAMSLLAYREGAASLPSVLEAQRNAREVIAEYVDDLASVLNATATLRVVTLTSASAPR
ncbi:MAG TPA: TolC family protein [Gemmatimonadaceae bacterium]